MDLKLLLKGLKYPWKIPSYLFYKFQIIYNKRILKRIRFNYERVVTGWDQGGAGLPQYSARLYKEVKLLRKAIGNFRAENSLEIGCGYGRLTPWIMEYSKQHYAIEPEHFLVNDAKKLYPEVNFYKTVAQNLPFPNNYFDLCISWTVLQHIPSEKELRKAVDEIKRVCKSDALIIITEETEGDKGEITWTHSIEEWKDLFNPWNLNWYRERELEYTNKSHSGMVMRFLKE